MSHSASILVGLSLAVFAARGVSAQQCPVVDLMPQFWSIVDDHSRAYPEMQIEEFRRGLIQDRGDLYSRTGVGFSSDQELNDAILRELAAVRANPESIRSMGALLERELPAYIDNFQRYFPDFRCDFPIYLLPSLGKLDGAGRVINHQPSLLIGVDNAAAEYTPSTLRVFIDHELFHRYHFQAAGFSDDGGDREVIWRALWAEGLATYASTMLNPGTTLQDVLILPKDLVARAQPRISSLIAQITPDLNQSDPVTFAAFFEYHSAKTPIPSRAGYYLGARVAEQLSAHASLFALAHLQSGAARAKVTQALETLRRKNFSRRSAALVKSRGFWEPGTSIK